MLWTFSMFFKSFDGVGMMWGRLMCRSVVFPIIMFCERLIKNKYLQQMEDITKRTSKTKESSHRCNYTRPAIAWVVRLFNMVTN